jgi:hypothetical protein
MTECSIPTCPRPATTRALCNSHYQKWRRGAPHPAPLARTPKGKYTTCTLEGCTGKHFGKGLCQKHYQRQWSGAPLEGEPRRRLGENHPAARLTAAQVHEIRALHTAGVSSADLARRLQVSVDAVRGVVNGRTWKHIEIGGDHAARDPGSQFGTSTLPRPQTPSA